MHNARGSSRGLLPVWAVAWACLLLVSGNIGQHIPLEAWTLQNSVLLPAGVNGANLSQPHYTPTGWHSVSVPCTFLAGLQQNGLYQDAYHSLNLLDIPRVQFSFPWWYRTEFQVAEPSRPHLLWLEGVNYRASLWLNGKRLASPQEMVGTFRAYQLLLPSELLQVGRNGLAVEVYRPYDSWTPPSNELTDLAISWIDWAPFAPDGNAGLWRPVSLRVLGTEGVDLRYALVSTRVGAGGQTAQFDFSVEAQCYGPSGCEGEWHVQVPGVGNYSQPMSLRAGGAQLWTMSNLSVSGEALHLWWPWQMGEPYLYSFHTFFVASGSGAPSLPLDGRFGLRQIESTLTGRGERLFHCNGQPILIRGGGWSSDLLLRRSPERQRLEFQYIRDMGLNAIRMEGKLEDEHFYQLADELGILLLPGWECCDAWQHWSAWQAEQHLVAVESLRSEVKRMRIHPSVLVFLYSSDELPPVDVEREYLRVFEEERWPNPTLNSAAQVNSTLTGPSGVKMSGPYVWEPPNYWLDDENVLYGGAWGFLTEGGPGASPMVLESVQATLPEEEMWPINFYWDYHCGNQQGLFGNLDYFTPPLEQRYGPAHSAHDYLYKAQVAAYESHRAMFEGYSRNKYKATGLIHWMMNNPWPSLIWHTYDWYLNPGGAFFGIKAALVPLHVMYSYNDQSVWLINSRYHDQTDLVVTADVYQADGTLFASHKASLARLEADGVASVLSVSLPPTGFYFVDLRVHQGGQVVDINQYWYNVQQDVLVWKNSSFYQTPCSSYADLTVLLQLPSVTLEVRQESSAATPGAHATPLQLEEGWQEQSYTLTNPSSSLAFFIHLRLKRADGTVVTPILWSANMFSLLPGESRAVTVAYSLVDTPTPPTLHYECYNDLHS